MRVSSRAVIINDNKVYLMFRRKVRFDGSINAFHCLPGGGQEAGETLQQNIVREVKEEFSLDVKILGYLGPNVDGNQLQHIFHCEIVGGDLKLGGEEAKVSNEKNFYEPQKIEIENMYNIDFRSTKFVEAALKKQYKPQP